MAVTEPEPVSDLQIILLTKRQWNDCGLLRKLKFQEFYTQARYHLIKRVTFWDK